MKIEKTSNYADFRKVKGNRPIVENKIKRLMKSYESGIDLFPYCPILVNKDFYVIDGQHRLEACKRLKLPVYYAVVPNFNLPQIANINANANRWKIDDFFHCYIENGNKEYVSLKHFKEKYSLSLNNAMQLLGKAAFHNGGTGDTFKESFINGTFEAKNMVLAEKIMKSVYHYQDFTDQSILVGANFIRAIIELLNSDLYEHESVLKKFREKKMVIEPKSSWKEYVYHIEELYNKGNQKRYLLYKSVQKAA